MEDEGVDFPTFLLLLKLVKYTQWYWVQSVGKYEEFGVRLNNNKMRRHVRNSLK